MKSKLRRFLYRFLFGVVALVTLVALFYAEENWRGARVWAATKREFAARGESLDLKPLIPPPVPDDQNLAMAPLFVRAFQYQPDPTNGVLTFGPDLRVPNKYSNILAKEELFSTLFGPNPPRDSIYPKSTARWSNGHHYNLAAWQAFYRQNNALPRTPEPQTPAKDILLAFSHSAPLLDELIRAADERPLTRFPVNWTVRPATNISMPHFNLLQTLVSTLDLRASAYLADGQAAPARQNLLLAMRLTHDVSLDPVLISALVEATCVEGFAQPLWDGLKSRQWSADDLSILQENLERLDLLRSLRQDLRVECTALFVQTMEDLQNPVFARQMAAQYAGEFPDTPPDTFWKAVRATLHIPDSPKRILWNFLPYAPRGWLMLNAAYGSRTFQAGEVDPIDVERGTIHWQAASDQERWQERQPLRPDNFAAKLMLPVFSSIQVRFAQAQATLSEAVTACALEHYFLDHSDYPATLAELVPTYLDKVRVDPFDGTPLRYRRTVDGRFLLYSIGADKHDDGGALEWPVKRTWRGGDNVYSKDPQSGMPAPERYKGDWVWQYAPAEPPDPPANTSRLEARP